MGMIISTQYFWENKKHDGNQTTNQLWIAMTTSEVAQSYWTCSNVASISHNFVRCECSGKPSPIIFFSRKCVYLKLVISMDIFKYDHVSQGLNLAPNQSCGINPLDIELHWIAGGLSHSQVITHNNEISHSGGKPCFFFTIGLAPPFLASPHVHKHRSFHGVPYGEGHRKTRRAKRVIWLVVGPPLWKILVNWDHYSQYIGKQKMFQTTNQKWFFGFWHVFDRTSFPLIGLITSRSMFFFRARATEGLVPGRVRETWSTLCIRGTLGSFEQTKSLMIKAIRGTLALHKGNQVLTGVNYHERHDQHYALN